MTYEEISKQFKVGDIYYYVFFGADEGVVEVKTTNPLTFTFPDLYKENKKYAQNLVESGGFVWTPFRPSTLQKLLDRPYKQQYKVYYRKEVSR